MGSSGAIAREEPLISFQGKRNFHDFPQTLSGVGYSSRTHFQGNNNMIFENYVMVETKKYFSKVLFIIT